MVQDDLLGLVDDPRRQSPSGRLAERLIELLDLPGDDPEVEQIAAMVRGALDTTLRTGRPGLLDDALRSAHERLVSRGLTGLTLSEVRATLEQAAASLPRPERDRFTSLLTIRPSDRNGPGSAPTGVPALEAYLNRVLHGDRAGAVAVARRCVAEGMDMFDILVDVLEPAQREVGRLWGHCLISIAQEHFCTAVTQFVMTDLYPVFFSGAEARRRLVAVHVPGSTHHVGLRMVTDVLEGRDWSTTYVTDEVDERTLPELVARDDYDLVLISASMPGHVNRVARMIRALREDPRTRLVWVVVGGRPFSVDPDLVEAVGADGWARDARSAVDVCNSLVGGERVGQ